MSRPNAEQWCVLACVGGRRVTEKAEFQRLGCTEQTEGGKFGDILTSKGAIIAIQTQITKNYYY